MLFILEPAPKPVVAPVGLETALKQVGATQLFRSNSEVSQSSIVWGLYYSLTLIARRPQRKTCSHVWPIVSHCHENLLESEMNVLYLPWNLKHLFLSFQPRKWWRRTKLRLCRKYIHFSFVTIAERHSQNDWGGKGWTTRAAQSLGRYSISASPPVIGSHGFGYGRYTEAYFIDKLETGSIYYPSFH